MLAFYALAALVHVGGAGQPPRSIYCTLHRFRYKDYRKNGQHAPKTMVLPAIEFIRRFLQHVLPLGFQRIRYYGFLGNRHRRAKLAR